MPSDEARAKIVELFGEDLSEIEILIIWAIRQRYLQLSLEDLITIIKCGMVIADNRADRANAPRQAAYNG